MSQTLVTCDPTKTISFALTVGNGWKQLTAGLTPVPTFCLRVKIMAPRASHGVALNTADILVLQAATQPQVVDGGDALPSDGSRDNYFHVTDPRGLWLKGTNASDGVQVRIEFQ